MNLGQLNQTVILIDTDYLNQKIVYNLEVYQEVYPEKKFQKIKLSELLYKILLNARVEEAGNNIDILFAYTLSNSQLIHCEPNNVFNFIDVHSVSMETDKGTLKIKSFFSDEDESCSEHFINMLEMIYHNPRVSHIIMIADNKELNPILMKMYEQADKVLFMLKDYQTSEIEVPIRYVKIDYPIAYSLGLKHEEL